jgi:hypothetical protein
LLGDALEEGVSLKQGRKYSVEYEEDVYAWVERTYNLIDDAFGKDEAQRLISNEGYTDQELFGRELPSFMLLSSTQRK